MKNYNFGDIVYISFPLVSGAGTKKRPALVFFDTGDDDIVTCSITHIRRNTPYDVEIVQWKSVGLNVPSTMRVHKIATLEKVNVIRVLGKLTGQDLQNAKDTFMNLCKTL